MFRRGIVLISLLAVITGATAAAAAGNGDQDDGPSLELLEFLGDWEQDSEWLDRELADLRQEKSYGSEEVTRDEDH